MNFLIKLILTSASILLADYLLPGIHVTDYITAFLVACLLTILNATVRPVLVILTIPITFLTLGLFLLVINAFLVIVTGMVIDDFQVENFWWALLFSLIISFFNSIFEKKDQGNRSR